MIQACKDFGYIEYELGKRYGKKHRLEVYAKLLLELKNHGTIFGINIPDEKEN